MTRCSASLACSYPSNSRRLTGREARAFESPFATDLNPNRSWAMVHRLWSVRACEENRVKLNLRVGAELICIVSLSFLGCTPFKELPDGATDSGADIDTRVDTAEDVPPDVASSDILPDLGDNVTGSGGSPGSGDGGSSAGTTGGGFAGNGGAGGRPGSGGLTGPNGSGGLGGQGASDMGGGATGGSAGGASGQSCPDGQHRCAGNCVEDKSPDHCGSSCDPCTPPSGGTATCDGSKCGFACASPAKQCGAKCTSGCCVDADCPIQAGTTGRCDTSTNACDYACAAGFKPCGTGNCIPETNCCSPSDCPGTCRTCSANGSCVSVINADDTDSCMGTCDAAATCRSKRGQTCQTGNGCVSGTTCAPDGYCCDKACTNSCQACDIPGFLGICTPVASGAPHGNRAACAGAGTTCGGTCANKSDGACTYPTLTCGSAQSCVGGVKTGTTQCDGAGHCPAGPTTTCTIGCNATGTDCLTCASGQAACGGVCCPTGQGCCGNACVDINSSAQHCGASCTACSGTKPICAGGACVECTTNTDCPSTKPTCDQASHSCVCRRPSASNLLVNPGFDTGIGSWERRPSGGHLAVWNSADADGCPDSGSAYAGDSGISPDPTQCVQVTGATYYYLGGKLRANSMPQVSLSACGLLQFSDTDCVTYAGGASPGFNTGGAVGTWVGGADAFTTEVSTKSVLIDCFLIDTNVDQLYINASGASF